MNTGDLFVITYNESIVADVEIIKECHNFFSILKESECFDILTLCE